MPKLSERACHKMRIDMATDVLEREAITPMLSEHARRKMRIDIAKDVLQHLRSLNLHKGSYINGMFLCGFSNDDDVRNHLSFLRKKCAVCAKGAMMLSYVGLYDKLKIKTLFHGCYDDNVYTSFIFANAEKLHETLKIAFDSVTLDRIEAAFETWSQIDSEAAGFGLRFTNLTRRLRAIMQNIIDNHGEFKPEIQRKKAKTTTVSSSQKFSSRKQSPDYCLPFSVAG